MNDAVRDCLATGYGDLIDTLSLPDPDDRQVLAAAIRTGAEIIVTFNLRDFPAATLEDFEIQAIHPDDFLVSLLDQTPNDVCAAMKRQRESLQNRHRLWMNYLPRCRGRDCQSPLPVSGGSQ